MLDAHVVFPSFSVSLLMFYSLGFYRHKFVRFSYIFLPRDLLPCYSDIYSIAFPKDKALIKVAVSWVYLIGVAQTVLALMDFYNSTVTHSLFRDHGIVQRPPDHFWISVTASSAIGRRYFL